MRGKSASNNRPRCKAHLAHTHVESHKKGLFLCWEDGGDGCYCTVGHTSRPNTRDNTADDEHGRRMRCSAYSRSDFEDDEKDKKGPLYDDLVRVDFRSHDA